MTNVKQPIADGTFTEAELLDQNLKNAKQALQVMEDLDKISTPLEVSIYMAGQRSTYRNNAYRTMVANMDKDTKKELSQFIKTNDPKLMERLFGRKK
jgi:formylmethanofuran:tetrahydromethanopterin formyltransferase